MLAKIVSHANVRISKGIVFFYLNFYRFMAHRLDMTFEKKIDCYIYRLKLNIVKFRNSDSSLFLIFSVSHSFAPL